MQNVAFFYSLVYQQLSTELLDQELLAEHDRLLFLFNVLRVYCGLVNNYSKLIDLSHKKFIDFHCLFYDSIIV